MSDKPSSSKRRIKSSAKLSTPRKELTFDWDKDDEELDLEETLFGKSKKQRIGVDGRGRSGPTAYGLDGAGAAENDVARLGSMQDEELFTIDAPVFGSDAEGSEENEGKSDSDSSEDHHDLDSSVNYDDPSDEDEKDRPKIIIPDDIAPPIKFRNGKEPLWSDPADDIIAVSLTNDRRMKKLARGKQGDGNVRGKELEQRLREQFEKLHPKPKWSELRRQTGTPALSSLLSSTKSFIGSTGGSRSHLPQGVIEIQRLQNANQQNPTTGKKAAAGAGGGVVDLTWHPSSHVGVLAVAGGDRRVRFFNIDGHTNPTLMTLHIPALPLTRSTFHPSGSSILLTGTRPFYYSYDLASQRCLRSARNLFGSVPSPTSPQSLTTHSFSPDGSLLAVAGRRGCVSVVEWSNAGSSGAVVAELRSGRGGATADIMWSPDGREISVLGGRDGAEVEIWNVAERRISSKWSDNRAFGGTTIKRSRDGSFTAIGSTTGIVNLYSNSSLAVAPARKDTALPVLSPEPIKSLEHLTTPITAMSFHPSGQLLATSSVRKVDAFRLYHLPSGTAYSNWPTPATPLARVTSVGFSSGGEYMAVGNTKGIVLLWGLKHFAV